MISVFAWSATAQGDPSMDLTVKYDASADVAAVTWYPATGNAARFEVVLYDAGGGVFSTLNLEASIRACTVEGASARQVDAISVVAYGPDGTPVETSPKESLRRPPADASSGTVRVLAAPASACGLSLQLVGVKADTFPLLYVSVRATLGGVPLGTLLETNFLAYEEGRPQTDLFGVTLPDQSGGTRLADIVFLIDTSGSMCAYIADVVANASAFADGLAASGINYQLAAVRFGQTANNGAPSVALPLTPAISSFKSTLSSWACGGGTEPGFQAIRVAIQQLAFRPGAQKIFVLITDEESDDRDKATTVNLVLANGVTVHTAVDCSFVTSGSDYCDATSVRGVSGGLQFNVQGPYEPILGTILTNLANTYIVRYRTDNPIADGRERCGQIVATNDSCGAGVQFCYSPGGAPVIIRTLQTMALHRQPLLEGTTPEICVQVRDNVPPYVTAVTLYTRTSGTNAFTELAMTAAPGGHPSNNIYCVTIPAHLVQTPGVDYYVRATDGQVTSSAPSTDPLTLPYQLAVLPNLAPDIIHVPKASWFPGVDLPLDVQCSDNTMTLSSLAVFYRLQGELLWNTNLMVYTAPQPTNVTETFTIAGTYIVPPILEYFIKAVDNTGVSSVWPERGADQPYELPILSNIPPVPICSSLTVSNDLGLCSATVTEQQVDAGSYDPDGGPVTLALAPPGPYGVGTTNPVTLTVTDTKGSSATCTATIVVVDAEAPVVTCPADITVEFADEHGAPVTFAATATDNCDPSPVVECVPPSGSVFPIGASTVVCTATDVAGNPATCRFQVTVLGAQGTKENLLAELAALRDTVQEEPDQEKLDKAMEHLAKSLEPDLWVDEDHLAVKHGDKVFKEEAKAVHELEKLKKEKKSEIADAVLQRFIDRLVKVDRLLAVVGIEAARQAGAKPKKLEHAQKEMDKAAEELAKGHYAQAIEHYGHAWKTVMHGKITGFKGMPDGTVRLEYIGDPGVKYQIEVSSNLVDWVVIATVTADADGVIVFEDPAAKHAKTGYYRVAEVMP